MFPTQLLSSKEDYRDVGAVASVPGGQARSSSDVDLDSSDMDTLSMPGPHAADADTAPTAKPEPELLEELAPDAPVRMRPAAQDDPAAKKTKVDPEPELCSSSDAEDQKVDMDAQEEAEQKLFGEKIRRRGLPQHACIEQVDRQGDLGERSRRCRGHAAQAAPQRPAGREE